MGTVRDQFDLAGRTAVVTGASRGIGQALALALAEAGADIIGVSRNLAPEGGETGRLIAALGRRFSAYQCDFADRHDLYRFVKEAKEREAPVDILVNNAGMIQRKPAAEHPDEWWDQVIEVNQSAPFILAREFGREMLARGRGKIIFTASMLSFQGGILVPGYAASKSAVAGIVRALANEWAGRGVNVNAIAPGYIATDNTAALRADAERSASILGRIPAGRWGTPDDLKGAVVFLASAASDYVHGTILAVDGGWLAR
ncbi:MAG: 2-dehydro-3-deoxy-D-gluconate 5-dehydrogenase KduD [bacterium]|nr:2-dehydro-3-deoxy-D-gluconate 5-dehydrogenase KduD [bacterium]